MKNENNDDNVEELSLSTSSNNINNNNNEQIGLDLLANSKKMNFKKVNQHNDDVKHNEIDLDENNITNQEEIIDNVNNVDNEDNNKSDNTERLGSFLRLSEIVFFKGNVGFNSKEVD